MSVTVSGDNEASLVLSVTDVVLTRGDHVQLAELSEAIALINGVTRVTQHVKLLESDALGDSEASSDVDKERTTLLSTWTFNLFADVALDFVQTALESFVKKDPQFELVVHVAASDDDDEAVIEVYTTALIEDIKLTTASELDAAYDLIKKHKDLVDFDIVFPEEKEVAKISSASTLAMSGVVLLVAVF